MLLFQQMSIGSHSEVTLPFGELRGDCLTVHTHPNVRATEGTPAVGGRGLPRHCADTRLFGLGMRVGGERHQERTLWFRVPGSVLPRFTHLLTSASPGEGSGEEFPDTPGRGKAISLLLFLMPLCA